MNKEEYNAKRRKYITGPDGSLIENPYYTNVVKPQQDKFHAKKLGLERRRTLEEAKAVARQRKKHLQEAKIYLSKHRMRHLRGLIEKGKTDVFIMSYHSVPQSTVQKIRKEIDEEKANNTNEENTG